MGCKTDWTDMEKNTFHGKVIFVINQTWNNKVFYPFLGSLSLSVSLMVRIYLSQ